MKDLATLMMVTYNRLDLTQETLDNIIRNTSHPFNLVIVDNGSSDGTFDWIKDNFSKREDRGSMQDFTFQANKRNQGIAIGRNQALFLATRDEEVKWLSTIDNDVWLPKGWLAESIEILKSVPSYGSIGVNFEPVRYPIVTINGKTFQNKPQGNLGTACTVFNKKLHKMLGYYNHSDYGKYGEEDADWGMRTRVLGFKLGYVKEMGRHLGEGERDVGEYRDFKTESHKNNLAKFNKNCRDYATKKKSLYIPFDINAVTD